jgi:hypothetical protein
MQFSNSRGGIHNISVVIMAVNQSPGGAQRENRDLGGTVG